MTDPIYPDKTKTGLAALKPLTDVFFESEESVNRWQWQIRPTDCKDCWDDMDIDNIFMCCHTGDRAHCVRLTPKPRRVWIGDQWYWEHQFKDGDSLADCYLADLVLDEAVEAKIFTSARVQVAMDNGLLFWDKDAAQQCLDAYRKARRVE